MKRFAPAVLVLFALAGCTQAEPSSVEQFTGAEADVAQKIEDLEKDGRTNKPSDICSDILAKELVDQLKAGGTTCETAKACFDLVADGKDIAYKGVSLRLGGFTDVGEP